MEWDKHGLGVSDGLFFFLCHFELGGLEPLALGALGFHLSNEGVG